jgi:hypothetical protein
MTIIEFCGGTSVGKTTLVKELKSRSKYITTDVDYIFRWLKIPYTRWTCRFILHPFVYFHFLRLCIYRRYCFYTFFGYVFKKQKYPFLIKLKLCNSFIRTFGISFFLSRQDIAKNNAIVLRDEGPIQIINNIISTFHDEINVNCQLWKQLFSKLPNELFSKIVVIHDADKM